ncbi:hypothetical protein H6F44_11600 [Pseudanabaena sp. FACHB-1277]|jgi:hypothetical protein|uniref:Uncharacterized protein n=1 Tax=Pseudanabaena cinerea FACHB-1277 TaxID=2949581 RepID=A0A926UT20_9CYAN|nr:hypothetical protein [Pseudanabaena cinerea]MBD2150759.1 hypothetical protein [Pseudanabaena cinerea FACHB-1277]
MDAYISKQNLFMVIGIYVVYLLIFGRKPRYYWASAWKAFALSIPTFMGTIVGLLEVYRFLIIYILAKFLQIEESEIFLFGIILFFLFALIIHVVYVCIGATIIRLFKSNPPHWLVPSRWSTVFSSFLVTTFATSIPSLIFVPLFISYRRPISEILIYTGSRSSEFLGITYIFWLFSALWIYHALAILKDYLRKHIKKANKSKPETPKSQVDPLDRDLTNLKHRTGIHFKKPPK